MKSPVAITLIIVGGLLILGPAFTDYTARAQVASILAQQKFTSLNLDPPPMSSTYRFGCWLAGSAMIAAAVYSSRSRCGRSKEE